MAQVVSTRTRNLTTKQEHDLVRSFRLGAGTIHGLAAIYDVSIQTVKRTLDTYSVHHGKNAATNRNLTVDEIVKLVGRS